MQPTDIKAWGRTQAAFLFLPPPPLPLLILALGERERENPTSALTSSPCYVDLVCHADVAQLIPHDLSNAPLDQQKLLGIKSMCQVCTATMWYWAVRIPSSLSQPSAGRSQEADS